MELQKNARSRNLDRRCAAEMVKPLPLHFFQESKRPERHWSTSKCRIDGALNWRYINPRAYVVGGAAELKNWCRSGGHRFRRCIPHVHTLQHVSEKILLCIRQTPKQEVKHGRKRFLFGNGIRNDGMES
jgi:hypothetical protein